METRLYPTQSEPLPEVEAVHGWEIAGEICDTAIALFMGRLHPPLFQKAVVTMESAKVQRHGLRLSSEKLAGGDSRLHLTDADTGRSCATFHFVSDFEDLVRRRHHG